MNTEQTSNVHHAVRASASPPVLGRGHDIGTVTDKISSIVLTRGTPRWWLVGLAVSFALVMLLLYAVTYLFMRGIGIWGVNVPVSWGFSIVNFVWWIGIGHAGTLISAVLLLLRQEWRTSINRFAEAMTLFAVACAGIFPILHLGRPWLFYWLFPYPNTFDLWPQWRSPLVWDVFAVTTYGTISLIFWYVGLVPDLATLRDQAKSRPTQMIFGYGDDNCNSAACRFWSARPDYDAPFQQYVKGDLGNGSDGCLWLSHRVFYRLVQRQSV
jgi:hypothetical protein